MLGNEVISLENVWHYKQNTILLCFKGYILVGYSLSEGNVKAKIQWNDGCKVELSSVFTVDIK